MSKERPERLGLSPLPEEAWVDDDDPQPYGSDFPLCKNCGKPYLDHIDVDYGASGLELCPTYTEYRSGLERDD